MGEFTVRVVFSGLMLLLNGRSITDMNEPIKQYAAGLKKKAEISG